MTLFIFNIRFIMPTDELKPMPESKLDKALENIPEIEPSKKEVLPTPEKPSESEVKEKEGRIGEKAAAASAAAATKPALSAKKSKKLQDIEKILSEDLDELYFNLPPHEQQRFKESGEQAARRIEALMGAVKVKVKEVFRLIRDWMALIPGINKFFVEQEAKIKTEKILGIKDE